MPTFYARTIYPADGETDDFAVALDYETRSHVKVYNEIDGVYGEPLELGADYEWTSAAVIHFLVDHVPSTGNIVIRRETPRTSAAHTFTPSTITAADLNAASRRALFVAQEISDDIAELAGVEDIQSALSAMIQRPAKRTAIDYAVAHDASTNNNSAFAAMVAAMQAEGIREVVLSRNAAHVTRPVQLFDGIRLIAEDDTSEIRNTLAWSTSEFAGGNNNLRAPILAGNWHPAYLGSRALGASDPEPWVNVSVGLALSDAAVSAGDDRLQLASPEDAALFTTGKVYPIAARSVTLQESTGTQLRISRGHSLRRLMSKTGGLMIFDRPLGFTSSDTVWLVAWTGGSDQFGLRIGVADRFQIEGAKLSGFTSLGNNCATVYESRFSGCGGRSNTPFMMNALTHSAITDYGGTFTGSRAGEFKAGHHDGRVLGLDLLYEAVADAGDVGGPLLNCGEYCRDLLVRDFRVDAPGWGAEGSGQQHLFLLQPGQDCIFQQGTINAPSSFYVAVQFAADPGLPTQNCGLDQVRVHHGSDTNIVFAAGASLAEEPVGCFVRNHCRLTSTASVIQGVAYAGGEGNSVRNSEFGGKISYTGAAVGNITEYNITDTTTVDGSAAELNTTGRNRKRNAGAQHTDFGTP